MLKIEKQLVKSEIISERIHFLSSKYKSSKFFSRNKYFSIIYYFVTIYDKLKTLFSEMPMKMSFLNF